MEQPHVLHRSEDGRNFFRLLVLVLCARGGHGLSKELQAENQHDMLQVSLCCRLDLLVNLMLPM